MGERPTWEPSVINLSTPTVSQGRLREVPTVTNSMPYRALTRVSHTVAQHLRTRPEEGLSCPDTPKHLQTPLIPHSPQIEFTGAPEEYISQVEATVSSHFINRLPDYHSHQPSGIGLPFHCIAYLAGLFTAIQVSAAALSILLSVSTSQFVC